MGASAVPAATAAATPQPAETLAAPLPTAAPAIEAPTSTPPFPTAQIAADRIADLRLLRTIGRGQALSAAIAPGGRLLAVATTAGVALLELPDLRELRFTPVERLPGQLTFSPDGALIADVLASAGGGSPRTYVRRVSDDRVVAELDGAAPAFSPDGQLIATVLPGASAPTTQLWRLADGARVLAFAGAAPAFSGSGKLVATISVEAGVSMAEVRRTDGTLVLRAPGDAARLTPDESQLAIAAGPNVELYRLADRQLVASLATGASGRLAALELTPDGRQLRVLADLTIQTWDITSHQLERTTPELPLSGDFDSAQFSPGGAALLVRESLGEGGALLALFDAADGRGLLEQGDSLATGTYAFGPSGDLVAIVIGGEVQLFDLAGQPRGAIELAGFERIAFSPDAQTLATMTDDAVSLWRVIDGAQERTLARDASCPVIERRGDWLSYSPSGELVAATALWNFGGPFLHVTRWGGGPEAAADRCVNSAEHILWAFTGARSALAFGKQLEIQGAGEMTRTVGLDGPASALAFRPDGGLLALARLDGGALLYDTASAAVVGTLPLDGAAAELAFSPDGTLLAARRADGATVIWRVASRVALAPIQLAGDARRVAITADNQLLIAGGGSGVEFFQIDTGARLGAIPVTADDLAIGPRRRLLAVLHAGQVQLWGIP
jgi:WD40 repeat protein